VFALFSPYLAAKVDEKKKGRDPAYARREAIVELLLQGRRQWWHFGEFDGEPETAGLAENLDPKWLDLAVKLGRADLVMALAVPGHKKANEFLAATFKQQLAKSGEDYEMIGTLGTMIRVGHTGATDATIELIKFSAKSKASYSDYWLGRLIPRLPKAEAIAKLEALVPELPEKTSDQLLDHLAALKNA
jgi:hypothetical protein